MAQPEIRSAQDRTIIESLLHREVAVTGACLLALILLAWLWLWREASGMATMETMPDMSSMVMAPSDPWSLTYIGTAFLMWTIMMMAMMLPSASPMILLHARFARRSGGNLADTMLFALPYAAIWTLFALMAALAQAAMLSSSLISDMDLTFGEQRLAALLLIATGGYQLSTVKQTCLSHCRSPVSFLMRYWKPGRAGALKMGARHGLFCLGCCAMLMLLLFVGGVMNLAWIALLTVIVAVEKFSPAWLRMSQFLASGLILLGVALFTFSFDIFPIAL